MKFLCFLQAKAELEKIRRKLEAELAEVHHQLEEAKVQVSLNISKVANHWPALTVISFQADRDIQ